MSETQINFEPTGCIDCAFDGVCDHTRNGHAENMKGLNEWEIFQLQNTGTEYKPVRSLDARISKSLEVLYPDTQEQTLSPISDEATQLSTEKETLTNLENNNILSELELAKYDSEIERRNTEHYFNPESIFENGDYELDGTSNAVFKKNEVGDWDIVFNPGEQELSMRKYIPEAGEIISGLLENGYYVVESDEGLSTIYRREGNEVTAASFVKNEALLSGDEDEIPTLQPTPETTSTQVLRTEFDEHNEQSRSETGISLKTGANEEKSANKTSTKIDVRTHLNFLKAIGVIRRPEIEESFDSAPVATEVNLTETRSEEPITESEHTKAPEQQEETQKEKEEIGINTLFALDTESKSTISEKSTETNITQTSSATKTSIEKLQAKPEETVSAQAEVSPVAPTAPENPDNTPGLQTNEDGSTTIFAEIKMTPVVDVAPESTSYIEREVEIPRFIEDDIQTTDIPSQIETPRPINIEETPATEISEVVDVPQNLDRKAVVPEKVQEQSTEQPEIVQQIPERTPVETITPEAIPSIEEIVAEIRYERVEKVKQPAPVPEIVRAQITTPVTERVGVLNMSLPELQELREKTEKTVQKAEQALQILKVFRNRERVPESLGQFKQTGDQPITVVPIDTTAQEREAELLELAA